MTTFYGARNLGDKTITPCCPWDFSAEAAHPIRAMSKALRRETMLKETTEWNVYSAFRGSSPSQRISDTNPPDLMNGLAVDYDAKTPLEQIFKRVEEMEPNTRPQWIEISLSGKIRLVWVFERPVLVPSTAFAKALLKEFLNVFEAKTLLAGYDPASEKPSSMWTNGGTWYRVSDDKGELPPVPWAFCSGLVAAVSKRSDLFGPSEIPFAEIAAEVQKRWPGRWQGDFVLDATGVRFWDEKADAKAGCQVKPDGLLCFTGNVPFMHWAELFGQQWVNERRAINVGRIAENFYSSPDGYWEKLPDGTYGEIQRQDLLLRLTMHGLSDIKRKGQTTADAHAVLQHIQLTNKITGAMPLVHSRPGLVETEYGRFLNTVRLNPVPAVKGKTGTPEDFPWIWSFITGLFPKHPGCSDPLDHTLAWLQRSRSSLDNFLRTVGQAIFLCGPRNNGKTLFLMRIVKPILGNRHANPMAFLTGATQFSDDLYQGYLLAVNDEDSPDEQQRATMVSRLKAMVVNPEHRCHAKFKTPTITVWTGRLVVTLNDDPASVGMLLDVNPNTVDKQMFLASQPYAGVFPEQHILEAIIAAELPAFIWWLLNVYQPPQDILSNDRFGVKSYYDPSILKLSQQQSGSFHLTELLEHWRITSDAFDKGSEWVGSPTALLAALELNDTTTALARAWTVPRITKALTMLSRITNSGVTQNHDAAGREFTIKFTT